MRNARRQKEIEDMRLEIMNAALQLFTTEGYEHVSMRKIAARIEYSPTAIYNYFTNKEEILAGLLMHCYAGFLGSLQEAAVQREGKDAGERLRALLMAYIQFGLQHPDHYQLIFIDNVHQLQRIISGDNDRYKGFVLLVEMVKEAMEGNVLQTNDIQLVAQSLWASLHGVTSLLITFPQFGWDGEAFISFQIETMIRGLS